MGTSQSSNGAPSNQPIIPPWAPELPNVDPTNNNPPNSDTLDKEEPIKPPSPNSPPKRFEPARRSLGDWAKSGSGGSESMKKGIGEYIKKGYGGSSTASKRLSGTVNTAHGLYEALLGDNTLFQKSDSDSTAQINLANKSADQVIDIVIETVRPVDGTQDCEASRDSIKEALSSLLTAFPDADLLELTDEQRLLVVENYIAGDVFRRIDLDIGKTIRSRAETTSTALSRLKEIKDYVKETVSSAFKRLTKQGQILSVNFAKSTIQSAIKETCEVFEGYAQ